MAKVSTACNRYIMVDSTLLDEARPASDEASRAPAEMSTWELIATYRHALALSYYRPRGFLAKALANWLLISQRELESRGAWVAEIMPPHNM
jgi:hypothetical protein